MDGKQVTAGAVLLAAGGAVLASSGVPGGRLLVGCAAASVAWLALGTVTGTDGSF